MGSFEFEYPYLFGLLLLFFICFRFCKIRKPMLIFSNLPMLESVGDGGRGQIANILKYIAAIALVVAIASPVIKDEIVTQNAKGYELSLILDASGSMRENNKFGIVKNIVQDFITKRANDKLALSVFADFAYVAVPLTFDKTSIAQLLEKLNVGVAGVQRTALYEALFLSSNLFKSSESKNKIAILLTDGIDNAGSIPLDVAINTAKKYGIKVYTIGIGGRGDYNPAVLQKIAKDTGGVFYEADSVEKLQNVYKEIDSLEKSEIVTDKYVKKHYFFQYPLALGLLAMMLYMIFKNKE